MAVKNNPIFKDFITFNFKLKMRPLAGQSVDPAIYGLSYLPSILIKSRVVEERIFVHEFRLFLQENITWWLIL